jgi:hypothetical protein
MIPEEVILAVPQDSVPLSITPTIGTENCTPPETGLKKVGIPEMVKVFVSLVPTTE